MLAGIRRKHAKPPWEKEAVLGEDIRAKVNTLGHDLRGLRDRAILLLGSAAGLRRPETVGLDIVRDDQSDGHCWIEIVPHQGALVPLRGKSGPLAGATHSLCLPPRLRWNQQVYERQCPAAP